ncbi:MAG: hypothetical protein WDZ70_00305 [Candidatus Paceibacterota bacterium]
MKEQRISDTSKRLMIGTALFFDVLQSFIGLFHFIPIAGNFLAAILAYSISIFAFLTLFVWFTMKGVSFFRGRKAGRRALMWMSEYILILNSLPIPGWTLYTWYTIKLAQEEDKEKMEKKEGGNLRLVKGVGDTSGGKYRKAA